MEIRTMFEDGCCSLEVSDTGCGIPTKKINHIFEPFFTTKEVGQGTGLGLAIVFGIIKQSDGHIQVYSELNQGTTFKIYLPWVNDTPRPVVCPTPQVAPNCGFETILFVEDDTEMRALIKWVLQKYNYKLLEAKNGEEALKLFDSYPETIHMLLTDVVMPGMSGKALAEKILRKQPTLKVVYMSGYSNDAITHYGVSENGPNFLRKPFTPIDLVNKIRDMFDAQV